MHFIPKSEKEIAETNLWPVGEYHFEIAKAENTVSKASGNEMIKLTMNVVNDEAKSRIIYDYLLVSMEFKLRHCAVACGLLTKYEQGILDSSDFEGKTGILKLSIQKDTTGNYSDRNQVVDYIVENTEKKAPTKQEEPVENSLDDEVPY